MLKLSKKPTKQARNDSGNMAEFPVALFILVLVGVLPLLNMLFVGVSAACVYLCAMQTSSQASTQKTYTEALTATESEMASFNSSAFANFARLAPVGGYNNSGVDLYVQKTSVDVGNATELIGPNTPITGPIDKNLYIYEYAAKVNYDVTPFIKMDGLPFLADIPGLGQNFRLTMTAHKAAEYPQGLVGAGAVANLMGGTVPDKLNAPALQTLGFVSNPDSTGWNTPNIYDLIRQAGRHVVSQDVLTVDSRNFNWTPTTLNIPPNAQIWVDYKADGIWQVDPGWSPPCNADGETNCGDSPFPCGMVIGKVGLNGAPFALGLNKFNFPLPGNGSLLMGCKQGTSGTDPISINLSNPGEPKLPFVFQDRDNNSGVMTVRVIITQ